MYVCFVLYIRIDLIYNVALKDMYGVVFVACRVSFNAIGSKRQYELITSVWLIERDISYNSRPKLKIEAWWVSPLDK